MPENAAKKFIEKLEAAPPLNRNHTFTSSGGTVTIERKDGSDIDATHERSFRRHAGEVASDHRLSVTFHPPRGPKFEIKFHKRG